MSKKPYQLPPGTRFLTEAELDARRAAKLDKKLAAVEHQATSEGFELRLPKLRRGRRRRRRIPPGIFRRPF